MSVTIWQAVLLGFVQGLTEFLPVSSTAHLALVQHFLPGFSQPGVLFDVLLHLGTLAAVLFYLRERILGLLRGVVSQDETERSAALRLFGLLVLAVAMTAVVTLPLRKLAVEGMSEFRRMGFCLLATSALLFVASRIGLRRGEGGRRLEEVRFRDAAIVGLCQSASAIFHGFSRSGNTISVSLFTGMSRRAAAEFSFLLSIPTILDAALVESLHELKAGGAGFSTEALPASLVGMLTAAVVGYLAVSVLLRLVTSMKLLPFVVYCAALGLVLALAPPV